MLSFTIFKALHVTGVILLVGNVTVTAVWKVFADRTASPEVMAFAQRLVTITDWFLTVPGILLVMIGGFGAASTLGMHPFASGWVRASELLFGVAGLIWAVILVPAQIRQARTARTFRSGTPIPESYRRDARTWLWWGITATVLLLAAMVLMVMKPA